MVTSLGHSDRCVILALIEVVQSLYRGFGVETDGNVESGGPEPVLAVSYQILRNVEPILLDSIHDKCYD